MFKLSKHASIDIIEPEKEKVRLTSIVKRLFDYKIEAMRKLLNDPDIKALIPHMNNITDFSEYDDYMNEALLLLEKEAEEAGLDFRDIWLDGQK